MTDTAHDKRASSSSPEAGHKADTTKRIETTEQLRIAIDQGNGKVDATDPAVAPLGTDDEAGGTVETKSEPQPTNLFGEPLSTNLFGDVIYPKPKRS